MSGKHAFKVRGFKWAATSAGIKAGSMLDLGLIVADAPVPAAALFTTNHVKAAPVKLCQKHLGSGYAQAVLVNSGNANACTGQAGDRAARLTSKMLAQELGIAARHVLPASTGVIGAPLPTQSIVHAIPSLRASLSSTGWKAFSRAILTTDQGPKIAARTFSIDSRPCTMLGVAKGAGMIHPNMATTLAFVVTDVTAPSAVLQKALKDAARHTFNAISVDGDTSTNDMILLMASGASGARPVSATGRVYHHVVQALEQVLGELATAIVADGEGAEHTVRMTVTGLASESTCRRVAEALARSVLVKTALHGRDSNWGRLLMAAGNSGEPFDMDQVAIRIAGVPVVRAGVSLGKAAEQRAARAMKQSSYDIELQLGRASHRASYLTCDLGHAYVRINADYRS